MYKPEYQWAHLQNEFLFFFFVTGMFISTILIDVLEDRFVLPVHVFFFFPPFQVEEHT